MRDEDAANTAALHTFLHDRIKISGIVNSRINHGCASGATAKENGIRTRPRHDRWVRSQDNGVRVLHVLTSCS